MAYNDFVALVREKTKKNTTAAERSAAVGTSAVDRMVDYMKYQRIGFDKLGEDINALVSGAQGYLEGGWADGNATAAQKQSVSSMISRLKSAKQYYTNHPEQFSGDVSKSIEEIDRTLGSLTELSGYIDKAGAGYANYASREEYDKAISDYTFTSQYKDMSADELEHIVSDLKFLKWGHDMNGNGFALHGVNQDNYGERIAHLESLLAEKQVGNYVEWAKQQGDFAGNASYVDPGKEYKDAEGLEKIYMLLANPTLAYSDNVLAEKGYNPFDTSDPLKKLYGIFQAVGQTAEAGKMLEMSADERKTFYYLYNTGQTEQAEKYINALTDISGKRLSEDVNSFVTNMAAEHPWLSTIAAIGTDIVISLPNTIETIANAVVGGKYDRYSGFNILGGATDTIYSTVPRVWAEKYGWDKDMTSFIYSTGVSIAKNVGTSLLFGGYGGTKIGKIASLAAMGTQASGSTMRKLAEQGAQDWQIYTLGAISGVAEVAMEKVPLDKLIKIGKEGGKAGLKATLKNIVNQIGTEFTEEAATEIVNILADSIFRLNESELATAVGEKGLLAALKDSIGQVIMAGASGAVSGGFMGSVFSIYGGTVGSEQYRPVGKFIVDNGAANTLIEQGLKLGQGSEAYEIAELLQRRMANNKEGKLNAMSYADVGRLYALETAAVREQYMQATEKKLSEQLEAAGVKSSKAEGLSKALAKAISGEQMTRAETKAIGKSAQAMQLLEQSRAMLDPSRVAFNPIQKSTTYGIADGAMVITRLGNSNMYRVDLLPSANAERVASTGEIGDGAVRTLESQSVRQVETMVKKAAEGAGIADISSGFGEQISPDAAVAVTMLSAEMSGVNENVAGIAAGIAEAMGGDLRIVFDPELSATGDTGLYRKNYDGTREAQIAPTLGGVVSSLAHELFHDIEDTGAGKAFIAAAVEYAKTQPARNPEDGANRYEEVKHLYQTRKGVSDKAELETEVGAKIAGDILASEDALRAVLEHMKPQQKASLWQRLKRALTSLRNKLKGQKNAKPAETQLNVLERLYKQAFAQRVIQDAVENPRVGDPAADVKHKLAEELKKGKKVITDNEEVITDNDANEEKTQVGEESEKEKAPEREADVAAQNAQKYGVTTKADVAEEISATDKKNLKSIGQKKHVNDFDSNDIKATEKWARIFWDDENLKEKSPFFRAWFGEWRAHSTQRVNVVTQKSDTRGVKKNEDTGWPINRSAKVSGERHSSKASISGYSYLPYIDGIIENAVLLDSAISDKTNPNSLFYHYMYAVVDDGNGKHVIKLTVEEILNPGKTTERRAYKLIDIEKYQPSAGGSQNNSLTSSLKAGTIKSIADLVAFVKSFDKEFSPAPKVNKLMLDRGRPKVFYHGTKAKFTVFDRSKLSDILGFFFTDDIREAQEYGEPHGYYLNVRNPIDIWSDEYSDKYADIKNADERIAALKAAGYDGIESYSHGTQWIIAFDSEQIKSATDNIGTFDKNNPDIRYEIAEDEIPNSSQRTIEDALYEAQEQSVKTWGKKDVEKLKMKATLARNGNVYSTAEVSKYVAKALRVISPSIVATVDGLGRTFDNVRTTAEAKKLVAAALTNVFNRNTSEKHRRQICEDCAAYLIANTFADDVTFAEDLEARQAQSYAAINVLKRYRGKLNVDPGDVDRVKKRIASKWLMPQVGATVGKGHSVFEVLNELAAVGVEIKLDGETWAELDVLNALDDLYSKSLETIGEDMKVSIGSPAEYKAYIDSVAESLYQAYEESGKPSEVKRINTDKNLEIAALLAEQDEALESERERFKDKFKDKVKEIRDREYEKRKKMRSEMMADKNLEIAALQAEHEKAIDNITLYAEIQKMIAAVKEFPKRKVKIGSLISPEWENIVKAAGKIIPQKFISPAGATDFADTFIKFLAVHAPTLLDYGKTYVEILGEAGDLFGDKRLKAAADKVNKLNEEAQTSSIPEDGKAEPAEDLEIYKLISKETAADVMWLSLRNRMYEDQQIEYELNRAEKKAQREGRELSNAEAEEIRKNAVSKAKNIAFTPGELEVLRDIIKAVIRINKRYNQSYIDGRWQDTDKYSTLAISESNEYHGYAGTDATSKLKTAQLNAMTPQGVAAFAGGFAENGSVLEKLVKDLVVAETKKTRKLAQYLAEGVEFYEAKEHKKWRKHYNDDRINLEFDTVDAEGKPIKKNVVMTVGQAMALMCSTKRKQAELALSLSDIIFVGLEKRGKDVEKERTYERATIDDNITEKDLRTLAERQFLELKQKLSKIYTEQFSEEDKQFMKIVEKFFELSGDEKSATDILLTGTTNVIGGYYFPIIRSKWGRDLNLIGNDNQFGLITMTGLPFNHNTIENAKAPMFIMDIWDLFRKYANDLASYTTLTIPLQTLNRVYNCKVDIPGIKEKTLREYLEKHAWSGISGYLRDLMIQVQGNVSGTSLDATTAKVLNYLKSAHAKYALGFNVQTYLKQKTTEFAVMSSAPFSAWLKGMMWRPSAVDRDGAGKKRTDVFDLEGKMAQMRKYSEVAYIRQDRTELLRAYGALGTLGRVGDWTMKMVGRGDDIATLRIFSIAQYAAEKQSGYAVGTVENLKLAGQLADEWINEYNDTSAVTTKSAFARSGNMLWSALTMYSSATVKAFTRLTVKAGRVDALKVREKNSNVKPSKEAIKKAKNEFLKEVGVYVVSSVVLVALIEQLMRALRGQDEPKDNLKGWIEGMIGRELPPGLNELYDMTVAAIDVIPVVGTVIENLIGGYDTTSFAFDIVNGARDLAYSIGDVSLAVRNDEDVHWSGVIIKGVDNIGQALGLPTRNIRNIASCCVGLYSMISGDTVPRYKFDSLVYKPNYSEDLNAAIDAGDERLAETVADMLMVDRVGSSVGSEAAGEIVSLYASGETGVLPSKIGSKITVSINDESHEIELTAADQRELRAEYGKATGAVRRMVSTSAYSRLTTSERGVAVRDMNRLYMDRAKAKLHGADMTTAVAMTYLMSEGKYICAYAHIKAIKADKTVKNKATQIKRWLRSQGLSVAEQRAILYASGYRSEENLAAVKRLLRSASLSAKEKAAVRAALSIE